LEYRIMIKRYAVTTHWKFWVKKSLQKRFLKKNNVMVKHQ